MFVTGIGTSVSYHIASFGIALIKGKDFEIQSNRISSLLIKADFRVTSQENEKEKVDCARNKTREMHQPVDAGKRGNLAARLLARRAALRALLALPEGAIYYIYKEH